MPQAGAIAAVVGAVALLPVHAVLIDAPITNTSNSGVRNGGTASDHLPPATIPWGEKGINYTFVIAVGYLQINPRGPCCTTFMQKDPGM